MTGRWEAYYDPVGSGVPDWYISEDQERVIAELGDDGTPEKLKLMAKAPELRAALETLLDWAMDEANPPVALVVMAQEALT